MIKTTALHVHHRVHYAISTWNLLIWRFMEDKDTREPEENP